jgi:hypothetical protein
MRLTTFMLGVWTIIFLHEYASAQSASASAVPAPASLKCGEMNKFYEAKQLIEHTLNRPPGTEPVPSVLTAAAANLFKPETTPTTVNQDQAKSNIRVAAGTWIPVTIAHPADIGQDIWNSIYTLGAARTEEKTKDNQYDYAAIGAYITDRRSDQHVLSVKVPDVTTAFGQEWQLVAVACNGKTDQLLGYGVVHAYVTNQALAWIVSLCALAFFWFSVTFAVSQLNAAKLERVWQTAHPTTSGRTYRQRLWMFANAANPVFISQDSLGYGSISRFQVLLFTTVVGLVLLYIFIVSRALSPISESILLLLGISLTGGVLGRAIPSEWAALSPQSRLLLLGEHILRVRRDKPRLSDLVETQGEIDVAKVQALLFTGLVAITILLEGLGGLGDFAIPQQYIYILGLSQTAYVVSTWALPADTRKRIEQDLDQLRKAAANLRGSPTDERALNQFNQAKQAASSTLGETYLERFDAEKFNSLTPNQL